MILSNQLKQQIKEHALKEKPNEACGLILVSGDSLLAYPCKNISQNKQKHFEISPFDYLRASEDNKILGIYHSQSSFLPSSLDIINSLGHNLKSYIYSTEHDEFLEVTAEHLNYKKYLGIKFEIGKNDCFSLVRDFYKQELNIHIKDYFRSDKWLEQTPEIIEENYQIEGFVKVNEIKKFDILEFSFGHFAIYLDNDLILHHKRNKLSIIERLDDSYKARISNIYRFSS